jgi:predicted RNA methylase
MIYGNTPPAVVVKLLELAEVRADDVFYDLGCGFGVPTVVAARACKKSLGIEILPEVAAQAQKLTHTFEHAELELRETREMSWDGSTRSVYLHVRR